MRCSEKHSINASKNIWFFLLVTITFTISYNFANAQEEFIPPPSQLLTSFPFTLLTGGIIIVKAHMDNYPDTLNFIFDTGSGGISLDSFNSY